MGGNPRNLIIINFYQAAVTVKFFTCGYSNIISMRMEGGNSNLNSSQRTEMSWEGVDWINLAHVWDKLLDLVNTVMNFRVP
jgi:hypothetical protein